MSNEQKLQLADYVIEHSGDILRAIASDECTQIRWANLHPVGSPEEDIGGENALSCHVLFKDLEALLNV